jgi:uncharacterized membrane protein YccC
MTETFVAIVAMMVALLAALGTAIGLSAAFAACRDWQRERASRNCEPGRSHRFEGVGERRKLRP